VHFYQELFIEDSIEGFEDETSVTSVESCTFERLNHSGRTGRVAHVWLHRGRDHDPE